MMKMEAMDQEIEIMFGRVKISNRIFEQMLYNYFYSKLENKTDMSNYNFIINNYY